ncbi:hypothetical protein [Saccharicrinis aurantiacus]|uniref:hypothetical protein n=1 Tax=Saccharicrinis aurantiacus TaxID=1849719 RepID=UPI00094F9F96|nr:hypothetical protein [Saccharicrinis aurantiacus]
MINIAEIKYKLDNNKALKFNLDLLVDYSISSKTLIFNQDIDGIAFEKLSEYQIIKLQSNKYHLIDFEVFGFCIYNLYKRKSKIKLTCDFNTFVSLLKEIEADYKSSKFTRNLTTLMNQLWAIAILDSNQNFNIDCTVYLRSLDTKANRDDLFSFNEGYSSVLPLLNIKVAEFYQNGIRLINCTKSDVNYNMPLGSIIKGIRNKINQNVEWGLRCFEHSITQPDLEINFLIPIITGLYDELRSSFYRKYLEDKIFTNTLDVSIICGLSSVQYIKDEECELFFEIFNQVDKGNTHVLVNLPKLLFAIIRSKEVGLDKKHIKKSFELLADLLEIDNTNLICHILSENEFQDDHPKLRQRLIINFIRKRHFKQEYLNFINHFLWKLNDVIYLEKVLYAIAEVLPFKSISKNISSSLNEVRSKHTMEFDKIIVHLLIKDIAYFRFLATDIINDLYSSNYSFAYNILELNSLDQYKLWVSLFQINREPKYLLPCLLPLLKSKSELVKESFVCKLEEYTESYGSSVTKILKQKLDFNDNDLKAVFKRVQNHTDEFYKKNVLVKNGIKELNPSFSQNKLFVDYNKNHSRRFSLQIKKSSENDNSFMNLISKVVLLKGGGWKMDGRDEISKLGNFGTSFSLPRKYFINPELFDYEFHKETRGDWDKNSFKEIKRCLDNE